MTSSVFAAAVRQPASRRNSLSNDILFPFSINNRRSDSVKSLPPICAPPELAFGLPFVLGELQYFSVSFKHDRPRLLSFNIQLQLPRSAVARCNKSIVPAVFLSTAALSFFSCQYSALPSSTLYNTKFSLPSLVPLTSLCRRLLLLVGYFFALPMLLKANIPSYLSP